MIFSISINAHGRVLGGHRTQDLGSSVAGDTLLTPHTLSCTHISRHTSAVTFSVFTFSMFSKLYFIYQNIFPLNCPVLGDDIFTQIQTCTVQLMNRCCEKQDTLLFSSSITFEDIISIAKMKHE